MEEKVKYKETYKVLPCFTEAINSVMTYLLTSLSDFTWIGKVPAV